MPHTPPWRAASDRIVRATLHRGNGDRKALEAILPPVYNELRRLARYHLKQQRPNHTLQTTALVHEAYLRLVEEKSLQVKERGHFLGIAAQLTRLAHPAISFDATQELTPTGSNCKRGHRSNQPAHQRSACPLSLRRTPSEPPRKTLQQQLGQLVDRLFPPPADIERDGCVAAVQDEQEDLALAVRLRGLLEPRLRR
jgi:ECF sigma factor